MQEPAVRATASGTWLWKSDSGSREAECPTTSIFWKTVCRPTSRSALRHLREAAREAGTILFLTGDAVRDLTSGHAVRDLEVAVHGNALKLKKTMVKMGARFGAKTKIPAASICAFPARFASIWSARTALNIPNPASPFIIPLPSRRICAAATLPSTPWPSPSTRAPSAC